MKRFLLLFVAPTLLLWGFVVAPLATGGKTLILRDVLNAHLLNRTYLAESLRHATLPEIDPLRAGGQALLGNLNALPFYPDNALLLVGSAVWQLNAHFWMHWLIALWAMYALGRAFGLGREASFAAGATYAFSGYFFSHLNLYNVVAGVALAPALAAAALRTAGEKSRGRDLFATGILWALLVVAGEPVVALLALGAALLAVAIVAGRRAPWIRLGAAIGAGTLVAAPQIVETYRILPLSFRGHWGYDVATSVIGSFRPGAAIDWFLPFFFGRPDLGGVWGQYYFDDTTPIYFTLAPGLLAMALVPLGWTALRRREPRAIWAAVAAGAGIFLALARFNPAAAWLFKMEAFRLFRYPMKFWLLVAMGGALACGIAFERLADPLARRRLALALAALGAFFLATWSVCGFRPDLAETLLRKVYFTAKVESGLARHEILRYAGQSLLSIALVILLLAALAAASRRFEIGAAALLLLHVGSQLFFLAPAIPTDETAKLLALPEVLRDLPPGAVIVNGSYLDIFAPTTFDTGTYPDHRTIWLERRAVDEAYPFVGVLHGRRYELAISPEGLDSFLTQVIVLGFRNFKDARRIDVLEAFGVDDLILDRELDVAALSKVRLVSERESFGQKLVAYEIADRAGEAEFAGRVFYAPHMNAALESVFAPDFDPHTTAILAGERPPKEGAGGTVTLAKNEPEEVVAEVEAASDGVLFLRRAYLPIWRVEIDGQPAETRVVQLARLGVEVASGKHTIRFSIDRRPLAGALVASAAGLALLIALARRRGNQPAT